jgi:hypothetical protein
LALLVVGGYQWGFVAGGQQQTLQGFGIEIGIGILIDYGRNHLPS